MSTHNLITILFCHWQDTLQTFGVDHIATEGTFNHVVAAYSTSNRYYHNLKHIHHVLTTIATLQVYAKDLSAVQLAAWFHDIVYDTQAKNNEENSAEYANQLLTRLGIPVNHIATVTRLILNTKHHQAAVDDCDNQVLIDADLAILGTNQAQYWEYANAIRQEYAWIPETEYIKGRSQVLEKFLQRDRIYYTPLMFKIAEQSARSNIKAEVAMLGNST